jgi:hypothetical protein
METIRSKILKMKIDQKIFLYDYKISIFRADEVTYFLFDYNKENTVILFFNIKDIEKMLDYIYKE